MNAIKHDDASMYKARKEAFVSNLSGGTLLEINLVTLVAPAAILLWSTLQSRKSFFVPYGFLACTAEFLLNVCAILFAITAYSGAPLLLNVLLISPAVIIAALQTPQNASEKAPRRTAGASTQRDSTSKAPPSPSSLRVCHFLTNYRGGMMIITCLAILAVDFPIFPRRFAKAENWGTSLMDLGVGSFVFSAGVVSARSVMKSRASISASRGPRSFVGRFVASFRHSIPLLVLGVIRLYSVKGLDYAEHVTEYGVHWNFFFTLAFIPPFVEMSDLITTHLFSSYEILSLVFAVVYEIVLDSTSLKAYILISPRGPSLLSKNREGVFSFIGYLSIFLAGRGTGMVALALPKAPPKSIKAAAAEELAWRERKTLLRSLALRSLAWVGIYIFATDYRLGNVSVSRRLANLPYILWVVAFNNSQILLLCLIETVMFPATYMPAQHSSAKHESIRVASSKIMQAFNSNGLVVFLVANLLTGLVNLTINTLDTDEMTAMGILMGYAAILTGFALGLDAFGIKIKL